MGGVSEADAVAAGETFSLALLEDGTVLGWGSNYRGQLGDGSTTQQSTPVPVSGLSEVVAIAAAQDHSLALLEDGTVMAWGANNAGQLGDGTTADSDTPVSVSGLSEVVAVAAGPAHSLALLEDGTVAAWGSNAAGQLGIGTNTGPENCKGEFDPEVACSRTPVAISGINEAISVAAGGGQGAEGRSFAVLEDGTVLGWGENYGGMLGIGSSSGPETCHHNSWELPCSKVPAAVPGLTEVESVVAGWGHNLALLESGKVMGWGFNQFGQLGDGTTEDTESPVAVDGLNSASVIAAGSHASYASASASSLPTVTRLEPNYGPIAGGTSVKLIGTDLSGTTAVKFGTDDAESITVDSATEVTAVSPPGTGTVDVRVTTPAGSSSTGDGTVFNYAPVVARVEPDDGPVAGGTSVTIIGGNFTGATAVKFGSGGAESFSIDSDTEISAVSPEGHGIVDVTVTGPGGTSMKGRADQFGYGPIIDHIEPRVGPATGGTEITIAGFALREVEAVKFGSVAAASFTENPDGTVNAVSPPFQSGSASVPVTVTTPNGVSTTCECSSLLPKNYFRYAPTVTSVEPNEGPAAGGNMVAIHGTGFYGLRGPDEFPFVESVDFGSTKLTCPTGPNPWLSCSPVTFEVRSETEIVATAPPGIGTVDVTVSTHGGTSPNSAADHYGYGPAILSESATDITQHSATLRAQINPESGPAGAYYQFQLVSKANEYASEILCPPATPGFSSCIGTPLASALPIGFVSSGSEPHSVSLDLAGAGVALQPGATYHYRVLAAQRIASEDTIEWEAPTIFGADQTFTTQQTPQLCPFSSGDCKGDGPGQPPRKRIPCKGGKVKKHGRCVWKRKHRHHGSKKHRRGSSKDPGRGR